jgi:hypothetical protein
MGMGMGNEKKLGNGKRGMGTKKKFREWEKWEWERKKILGNGTNGNGNKKSCSRRTLATVPVCTKTVRSFKWLSTFVACRITSTVTNPTFHAIITINQRTFRTIVVIFTDSVNTLWYRT